MEESSSEINSEYISYDIKATSLSEYPPLNELSFERITSLRIMHSPILKSMKGTERFFKLKELNLSSNNIERMDCLEKLRDLKVLDLSCNKIRVINGLNGLFRLEKLILSHNKIVNIQNLKQMSGENSNLKYLDLCDNKIQDYKELLVLNEFMNLEILVFEQNKHSNPICKKKEFYYEVLRNLKYFHQYNLIDGFSPEKIMNEAILPEKPENKENINDLNKEKKILNSPQTKILNTSSPFKITKLKSRANDFIKDQKKYEEEENYKQIQENHEHHFQIKESEYLTEIFNLKTRLDELISDQRELIYKYESSEKFWEQKYEKLEKEFFEIMSQNKSYKKDNKKILNENSALKTELEQNKKENKEYIIKKERKEELVENLQLRISNLLKESSEFHKELSLKKEENDRLKHELRSNEDIIKELKASVRENEKILANFHSKSLENASYTLQRGEEMKKKFESVYEENKILVTENAEIKSKNAGLLDLTKEWEFKYESKMNELKFETEREIKKLIDDYEKQLFQLNHQINYAKKEQEMEFKNNLDLLEEEFKKVLNENNEKFRHLKALYEEKAKNEMDNKNLLRAAMLKNQEQENVIREFEQTLTRIKREVGEIIAERDSLRAEVISKKNFKDKETDQLQEEKTRILNEKQMIENNFAQIKDVRAQELQELSDLRKKVMLYENIANEVDDLKTHIETKTKILEDKNETIEALKEENDSLKYNYSALNEDFQRLSKKFDKKGEIIDELEQQFATLKEENDVLKKEIKEKKGIIKLFEGEIDNIRNTQENEVEGMKGNLKRKDEKIQELIKMLDECRVNLEHNQQILKEKDKFINDMEVQTTFKDNEWKNKLKSKEKEIDVFKAKLEENEEEMKILIFEIEKQKKMAKENIEKLNKIFNF